ncbi:Nucleotide-binding universal stress protein, UspA family [Flaviramulus basaltis]|uniref:Nucleotide-binding universal stress protein, UspA family n=1 Tax=Flaviramulus basaltis TaxID=369401 RepID=A0A1K2IIL9_9FLAO|nr:universal stress protein [Flaviramulus basaltis]SFZ92285.1 Nucleotide-binding universal stress protein, UspA family [Flaviramulus basaltis]
MKKILLPTDFSDNAWSAIVYALKLYKDESCVFYFLHSTKLKAMSSRTYITSSFIESINEEAMKEILALKELVETSDANTNHEFEIIISSNDLISAIKRIVKESNIDLVIMGTKGVTGANEFFFGTNTMRIIKNVKLCPVLIIPEEYDFTTPSQIAFPTDYNRFYSNKELKPLKELADLYDSKIRIMHINIQKELNDVQEYNLMMLKGYLNNYNHTFHWIPDYSKKEIEIKDFIEELEINILVMVNYKHSFIENIINEPVIKKIGFHPTVPFLVVPC